MKNQKTNKMSPIEIVERYHEKYLEYEKAFNDNPFDESTIRVELEKVIESGASFDSEEFENAVVDLMIEKPARRSDVNNAALKFFLYTEFYLLTEEEPLPKKIEEDYKNLPIGQELKPFYSIINGDFVRNEDVPINIQKDKLKELYKSLQAEK